MSIRAADPSDHHVHVRGTMISIRRMQPSCLPVRCVEQWGMPNQYGTLVCDGVLVHVRYDRTNDDVIHAWAEPPLATDNSNNKNGGGWCALS